MGTGNGWICSGHDCVTLLSCLLHLSGKEAVQGGETAVQGGGGDVEGSAASQHRSFLRLLGVAVEREEVHRSGDGAHDLRDT